MVESAGNLAEEAQRAIADVRAAFTAEFALMSEVRLFVEDVAVGPLSISNSSGINEGVVLIIRSLLAKGCKTLRAVEAVAGVGCGQDAGILLRAMFESSVACSWILQGNCKRRATMFAAHEDQRVAVLFEQAAATTGLKRQFTPALVAKARAKAGKWRKLLSAKQFEAVRRHWSGLGSLEKTCDRLGPYWRRAYALMYRHLCTFSHGSDVSAHVFGHPSTGQPVLKLLPGTDELDKVCTLGPTILLQMVKALDKRSGQPERQPIEEFNTRAVDLAKRRKGRA